MNKHIMLDIETLATNSRAAIVSIGGVVFSLDDGATLAGSNPDDSFLVSINDEFYGDQGGEFGEYDVDPSTCVWWEQQGVAAKEALSLNLVETPEQALDTMNVFFDRVKFKKGYKMDGDRVWANPCQFDMVIIRNAAEVERSSADDVPWHYRQETCMRTVFWMNNGQPRQVGDEGLVKHRADHDAVAQARALQRFYGAVKC